MSTDQSQSADQKPAYDDKIEVRCSRAERYNGLENARTAGFKSLSAFVRHSCLYDPVSGQSEEKRRPRPRQTLSPDDLKHIARLTREMNAIGNNLNQLVTLAHTDRIPRTDIYEARLEECLHELQLCLATVLKQTGNT